MFSKSIGHAVMVALCGLGIVILQAIIPALNTYHPSGLIATILVNSIVPILLAAIAGTIHFLTTQEQTKG